MTDTRKHLNRTLRKANLLCKHINNPVNGYMVEGTYESPTGETYKVEIIDNKYVMVLATFVADLEWMIKELEDTFDETKTRTVAKNCGYLVECMSNVDVMKAELIDNEDEEAKKALPIAEKYFALVDEVLTACSDLTAHLKRLMNRH